MKSRARRSIREFRVVVFQEDDWLCAQCLDFDLAVQGKTMASLYQKLQRMVLGHIAVRQAHGKEPFRDLPRAPRKYWDMYERAMVVLPPQMFRFSAVTRPSVEIPPPKVRILTAATR